MKKYSILIADDDFDDQRIIEDAIRFCNPRCAISYVYNGNQLLDYLFKKGRFKDTEDPDAVILDLKMPFMDGFGVLESLKINAIHVPVYVLSNFETDKTTESALRQVVKRVYTKPFQKSGFRKIIREILNDIEISSN
jgi:two-component system, response regulator